MSKLTALFLLLCVGYVFVVVVRLVIALICAPRGTFIDALSAAEFDREADDRHNPILRDRRFAEARGEYLE